MVANEVFEKDKRPLISDDIEGQKNGSQEYQKEKTDKPKTDLNYLYQDR